MKHVENYGFKCLLQMVSAVLPRVQELNAFANIVGEARTLEELPDEFFLGFSVILLTECTEVCVNMTKLLGVAALM